jgi:hypothetical protein
MSFSLSDIFFFDYALLALLNAAIYSLASASPIWRAMLAYMFPWLLATLFLYLNPPIKFDIVNVEGHWVGPQC